MTDLHKQAVEAAAGYINAYPGNNVKLTLLHDGYWGRWFNSLYDCWESTLWKDDRIIAEAKRLGWKGEVGG